ncbi:AlpA family transcriptional regulator [Escherichia coli]|uniref:helix-turn-helix transcriptional regulator n=1 Tax=Escherichia coli TaxID=562 RepID=UPI000F9E2704|nr:AlpA family transcriptional regulator [Escherichia coli]EED1400045.1 AlpA family transcriptional regulator [Escherichia coli]EEV6492600.1 AlpA family transcriptional regulator [Escherichia coli]EEW5073603.1 AlpA family transcriptional regulator [Escherichia coli]EFA9080070.1 AlpA family transcriptional regulator [Escherichia coli]EFG0192914.1 AlpA family transcriptional regulator [Escherichia coli]
MTTALIRMQEVQRRTSYSKQWIYKLIAKGRFPKPVKVGSRAVAFVEREIDEWINQVIEGSRNNAV